MDTITKSNKTLSSSESYTKLLFNCFTNRNSPVFGIYGAYGWVVNRGAFIPYALFIAQQDEPLCSSPSTVHNDWRIMCNEPNETPTNSPPLGPHHTEHTKPDKHVRRNNNKLEHFTRLMDSAAISLGHYSRPVVGSFI